MMMMMMISRCYNNMNTIFFLHIGGPEIPERVKLDWSGLARDFARPFPNGPARFFFPLRSLCVVSNRRFSGDGFFGFQSFGSGRGLRLFLLDDAVTGFQLCQSFLGGCQFAFQFANGFRQLRFLPLLSLVRFSQLCFCREYLSLHLGRFYFRRRALAYHQSRRLRRRRRFLASFLLEIHSAI